MKWNYWDEGCVYFKFWEALTKRLYQLPPQQAAQEYTCFLTLLTNMPIQAVKKEISLWFVLLVTSEMRIFSMCFPKHYPDGSEQISEWHPGKGVMFRDQSCTMCFQGKGLQVNPPIFRRIPALFLNLHGHVKKLLFKLPKNKMPWFAIISTSDF